ncbi:Zn-dependent hydrolase [Anaerovorax odorimutans]|uniref:Zn-dependent hydrolase n=1 Tax=Anaerovorax odorimutans TaxID=109327 RepID=A0ABT1RK49_9FIRM|nr:Zn-dependent hydrolase [Anaerovorax odorimutans]MCQ4635553.1 Zn-dependent hydrolase [Anaerovorax odorimutans]
MRINEERLKERMERINSIAVTEEDGMMRLALSDADKEARDLLVSWMEEAGMSVRVDDMGTIYGVMKGRDEKALPICVGSHMDTQPNGGRYDGFFGVMAGLEAILTIKESGAEFDSDLMVADWTNEEGARFVPPMLASGTNAGQFTAQWVYDRQDTEGIRYEDELKRIGYKGDKENRLTKAKAYLEPHIEQGPVLDAKGISCGIVTGALGITGLDVTISGEANHAGTTPMSHRKDALVAAAEAISRIRKNCIDFGEPAVITNGIINAQPASKNIVPGSVYFSIDLRYHTDEGMAELEKQTKDIIHKTCAELGTTAEIEQYWRAKPAIFNETIVRCVEEAAAEKGLSAMKIISGAGHDAVFINEIIPTGMIFVPSIKGMSHCPQEDTKWEDLVSGAELTADVLLKLDKETV